MSRKISLLLRLCQQKRVIDKPRLFLSRPRGLLLHKFLQTKGGKSLLKTSESFPKGRSTLTATTTLGRQGKVKKSPFYSTHVKHTGVTKYHRFSRKPKSVPEINSPCSYY